MLLLDLFQRSCWNK